MRAVDTPLSNWAVATIVLGRGQRVCARYINYNIVSRGRYGAHRLLHVGEGGREPNAPRAPARSGVIAAVGRALDGRARRRRRQTPGDSALGIPAGAWVPFSSIQADPEPRERQRRRAPERDETPSLLTLPLCLAVRLLLRAHNSIRDPNRDAGARPSAVRTPRDRSSTQSLRVLEEKERAELCSF